MRGFAICLMLVFPRVATAQAPESYELVWSTFFGGDGFDRAQGCAVDSSGAVYVVGNTFSDNLPTGDGVYQKTYGGDVAGGTGGGDGYVAKLSADGKTLVWATYLGGPDGDRAYGVQVDGQGYVYVSSWAGPGFPTTTGAYDETHNSPGAMDVAITKLYPDGSDLVWSTLIGGDGNEQSRNSMFVDAAGAVYSTGWTDSSNFPTTPGAFQTDPAGGTDAFAFKLSADGSDLLFSTLFGGSADDSAFSSVDVHSDGSVYFSGTTRSDDLPVTAGSYQEVYGGDTGAYAWHGDVFVVRMNSDLTQRVYATYLGGSSGEEASVNAGFTVDEAGRAIVIGNTTSGNFPVTTGAYQHDHAGGIGADGFISVLSADGSQLVASTFLGGSAEEEMGGVSIDQTGIYLTGLTESGNFPVTTNALLGTHAEDSGRSDAALSKLSLDLSTLLYSTYVGGSGTASNYGSDGDRGRCTALGPAGTVLLGGSTNSWDYPVTTGSYDEDYAGGAGAALTLFGLVAPGEDGGPDGGGRGDAGGGDAHFVGDGSGIAGGDPVRADDAQRSGVSSLGCSCAGDEPASPAVWLGWLLVVAWRRLSTRCALGRVAARSSKQTPC